MPSTLIEKILRRAEASAATPVAVGASGGARVFSRPLITLRELAAVAACLVLLAGVLVPALSSVRDRSQRARCARNLGSIYGGIRAYQEDYSGSLPYAGALDDAAWLPGAGNEGRPFASNSRHVFRAVKEGYVSDVRSFLCPSSLSTAVIDLEDIEDLDDFLDGDHLQYDSLNLAGVTPNVRPSKPIAYLGDENPLFDNGRFDPKVDATKANSRAHRGKGQNVLKTDGTATFLDTPVYGAQRDNVWLNGDVRKYDGTEVLTKEDDAQLVPGVPSGNRKGK